jgi:hypothetical protein
MARKRAETPYDVTLNADQKRDLVGWLCDAVQQSEDSRTASLADVEYWHKLYRQDLTRVGKQQPWADAADLTSYIGTEKVDAMRSRIMRTIFVEPIWTVEGWGASAEKAPIVEEFHQWQAEQEGLQRYLTRVIHLSLIEPRGVLEVYEDTVERRVRKQMRVGVQLNPISGLPLMGEDGEPVLVQGTDGQYVEVMDDLAASAEVIVDSTERVRRGPAYRVIPYRDFLVLPGHAADKADVWGYAKRIVRRVSDLKDRARAGIYDMQDVEALGTDGDQSPTTELTGVGMEKAPETDPDTAEKELWEVLFLRDLDNKGQRWYVATISVTQRVMLRVQHDDIGAGRYLVFTPFPRPDRACDGYSLIGHKLITTIEEHSAWRNMLADRAAMVVQAPVKRLEGALWDPEEQPWGPRAVIDVRQMEEVQPVVMPDLSQPAIEREASIMQASERIAGLNDVALGVAPQESRTLGEVNMVAEQSFIRIEEVVKNLQETLEELGQVRHVIWQRALASMPDGLPVPQGMLVGLEQRGISVDGMADSKIMARALDGNFRFKPRGSVETADVNRQRTDFVQFLQMLPQLIATWPALGQLVGQSPQAARSVLEQALRLFRFPDRQAILGDNTQAMLTQAMQPAPAPPQAMAPGMAPPPGMPGQPMPPQGGGVV